ncbi:MAG TPA: TonB-dependent receptor [Crocinitomicaceae bacterium]|nr:TonB-dependent receptor [Crocinitomicaceae bacterium]
MKKITTILTIFLFSGATFGQDNLGEVIGEVVEKGTTIPAYGAHIFINDNGAKYNALADADGRFRISAIPAGTYVVNIRYKGDTLEQRIIAEVPMDGFENLGVIHFYSDVLEIDVMDATYDRNAIRLIKGNLPVVTLTSEEIVRSPAKTNIKDLINSMSSDVRMTGDGELVFRGARKGDMLYLVDGVKTSTISNAPSSAIGRMMIYSGGLPAKYGDTMGGVVIMETKSYFDLYRGWEASQIRAGKM